jgi:hypothetical protein
MKLRLNSLSCSYGRASHWQVLWNYQKVLIKNINRLSVSFILRSNFVFAIVFPCSCGFDFLHSPLPIVQFTIRARMVYRTKKLNLKFKKRVLNHRPLNTCIDCPLTVSTRQEPSNANLGFFLCYFQCYK